MMKKENAYDFQKKLLQVHEKDVWDRSKAIPEDALLLKDGLIIEIGGTEDIVIQTAAADFADFFAVSMGIKAIVSATGEHCGPNVVRVALASETGADLGEAAGYKGFLIEIDEGIRVHGYDARGAAQGLFYLEDMMCMERAPFVRKGEIRKKPMFSPLMNHSGYAMEEFPDEYLMKMAHDGRDAIMVFVTGVNQTRVGYLDFNELVARAAKFGIDVYAYSFFLGGPGPHEENAQQFYEDTYGAIFKACPGFAGVTCVGEVLEYHSADPRVSPYLCYEPFTEFPDPRPKSGWFPCNDYPKLMTMIRDCVRKYNPNAKVVLWSYNWGYQPEKERVELIKNLPEGIILEATFEMFESWKVNGVTIKGSDYSLAIPGPGKYFTSEAIAAKKYDIPLYAMMQTAGETWDFGVIPYEPMPYQFMKRFEGLRKAKEEWNLQGGMECHHHGFYPSIITKFGKHAFLEPAEPLEQILDRILCGEYGEENLAKTQEGFRLWSEAITHYTPTGQDLNGPGRNGPSYPFCLFTKIPIPDKKEAMFGAKVVSVVYAPDRPAVNLRIRQEKESLEEMLRLMNEGVAVLESIANPNEKLLNIINLGKFIARCVQTTIHVKQWYMLRMKLQNSYSKDEMYQILDEMETLLHLEIKNAEETIPLVQADSRLGWEPSMLYLGDEEHLRWKIRQVQYVLNQEIPNFKKEVESILQ